MRIRNAALKSGLAALALMALPTPVVAQTASAPVSAEAISAARPVVDKIFPKGTYRRMMDGTMGAMMDQMFGSMFDMKAADMVGAVDSTGTATKAVGDATMGEVLGKADPHYRERMKITMDVMMKELIPLVEKVEPAMRDGLTTYYARKFTPAQLRDMDGFFGTPSGKVYAEHSMLAFMDPDIMKSMQGFVPDMMKAMPDIMRKVEAATAHLPKAGGMASDAATTGASDAIPVTVSEPATDAEPAWELSENWAPEFQSAYGRATDDMDKALDTMDTIRTKATAEAKKRLGGK